MQLKIRKATPTDARDIKSVHYHAYQVCYRGYLPDDFLDNMPFDEAVIERTANHIKEVEYYVAETKNHVIGFLALEYPEEKVIEIQMLYVHPDFQKQGVGSALMREMCLLKKNKSYNKLILWTIKDGPAIGFYHKQGMKESNIPPKKFWKLDIPIIRFEKELDNK